MPRTSAVRPGSVSVAVDNTGGWPPGAVLHFDNGDVMVVVSSSSTYLTLRRPGFKGWLEFWWLRLIQAFRRVDSTWR
jgi:hypothetical protein